MSVIAPQAMDVSLSRSEAIGGALERCRGKRLTAEGFEGFAEDQAIDEHDLDRDLAVERALPRAVDDAHRPFTEFVEQVASIPA